MKLNIKSRKGFTLIELLVVIGILAVLAAIAIPSVAGLIDRANVSADNTNANEYTNAIERFASEYELYKQDIASGLIKDYDNDGVPDNMNASQSRVYNVTKATKQEDIKALESVGGFNGICINIDNKYAQNSKTAQLIIQNYTKTTSSTFEPKQSDMTYWYHTETGYTIVVDKNATVDELQNMLPSQLRTNKENIAFWIDLSAPINIPSIQILGAYYGDYNSTWEDVLFEFEISNPKFTDIDFSKIYMLKKKGDGELTISSATDCYTLQSTIGNVEEFLSTQNEKTVILLTDLWLKKKENLKDTPMQCRFAFEYEDNGEIKYIYTPVFITTCNDLIAQGKIFSFNKQ